MTSLIRLTSEFLSTDSITKYSGEESGNVRLTVS